MRCCASLNININQTGSKAAFDFRLYVIFYFTLKREKKEKEEEKQISINNIYLSNYFYCFESECLLNRGSGFSSSTNTLFLLYIYSLYRNLNSHP